MAYRRLPNTDKSRIETIKALLIQLNTNKNNAIITTHQVETLKEYQAIFISLITRRQSLLNTRKNENETKQHLLTQLRLYISHFFQVLNFAIVRNEIDKSCRNNFGLEKNASGIPSLFSEKSIIQWAEKLIKGETKRIKEGATTISHPNIETIKELSEKTIESQNKLLQIEIENKQLQANIKIERNKLDEHIKKAWDDIEFYFKEESINNKRKKASEYGVAYVT